MEGRSHEINLVVFFDFDDGSKKPKVLALVDTNEGLLIWLLDRDCGQKLLGAETRDAAILIRSDAGSNGSASSVLRNRHQVVVT